MSGLVNKEYLDILKRLASDNLHLWGLQGCSVELINFTENVTFVISGADKKAILRMYRPLYHTKRAIESEIQWMNALREQGGVETPQVITGVDGGLFYHLETNDIEPRYAICFEFLQGKEPSADESLSKSFVQLGAITAKTHLHSKGWNLPDKFERLSWNLETIFGNEPNWGKWQDGPAISGKCRKVLTQCEKRITARIKSFEKGRNAYGLIHADMRLANLLLHENKTQVIDFDDCGFGYYLYDFATAISFIEDNPLVPTWKDAWIEGYRQVAPLSEVEENEIQTFIMLRRLTLLAWIGSHSETELAQSHQETFAENSIELAEGYLNDYA